MSQLAHEPQSGFCPQCGGELSTSGGCAACFMAAGLDATIATTSPSAAPDFDPNIAIDEDSFGAYEIEDLLGEGGMGTVYLAMQRHPIQRRVALKVVKLGLSTEAILARFNYERQSLASMDHPNIARVYDAAATRKGRPFFVMEYIDGEPITTYCDRHRLGARARLELFQRVCQAVQHAHSKGVLHRDIKPSNVLVTEVDGQPVPKIIDFGISKALDQTSVERTMFTEFGQLVGTPEYMSPEAADLVTGNVDAASDVYSLGVLLYELLVGALPFSASFLRKAGLLELLRILREEEVPPLPKKLTELGKSASEIAARRGTDLPQLRKQLSGDLNWIVMKAVEKSRERRYLSPHELLLDIQRHLEDRPVSASPPRMSYRVRKFARRNREAVIAAAVVAAVLIAGVVSTVTQAREAIRQGARAEANASLARQNQLRAEQQSAAARQNETRALSSERKAMENLSAVRTLAHSLLTQLDDEAKVIVGGTALRTSLVKLGSEYLSRATTPAGDDSSLVNAQRRMGELQASLFDRIEAAKHFESAISGLKLHLSKSPGDHAARRDLAETYLAMGEVTEDTIGKNPWLMRAKSLALELLAANPKDYRALNIRATVAIAENQPEQAYHDSELAFENSPKQDRDQARRIKIALRAAELLSDGDLQRAERILNEEKPVVERLVRTNPSNAEYRWLQSKWYFSAYRSFDEPSPLRAREALLEAHRLIDQLSAADPQNTQWLIEKARYGTEMAVYQIQLNQRAEGLKTMQGIIAELRQQLKRSNYLPEIAIEIANIMGRSENFLYTEGNRKLVVDQYASAIEEIREASRLFPGRRDLRVAEIRMRTGHLFHLGLSGEFSKALELMAVLEKDTERLQRDFPSTASRFWASVRSAVHGMLLVNSRREQEGMAKRNLATREIIRLLNENPDDMGLRSEAIVGLVTDAGFLNGFRRYEEAHKTALRALELAEYAWVRWPRKRGSLQMLFGPTFHLRYQYTSRGDYAAAIAISQRIVKAARESVSYVPTELFRHKTLGSTLINLAGDFERSGMREACYEAGREALSVLRRRDLVPEAATSFRRGIAESMVHIARMYADMLEIDEALGIMREMIDDYARIDKLDPGAMNAGSIRRNAWLDYERIAAAGGKRELAAEAVSEQLKLTPRPANPTPGQEFQIASLQIRLAQYRNQREQVGAVVSAASAAADKAIEIARKSPADLRLLETAIDLSRDAALLQQIAGNNSAALSASEKALALAQKLMESDQASKVFALRHRRILAETLWYRQLAGIPVPSFSLEQRLDAVNNLFERGVNLFGYWSEIGLRKVDSGAEALGKDGELSRARLLLNEIRYLTHILPSSKNPGAVQARRYEAAREAREVIARAAKHGPLDPDGQTLDWRSKILLSSCEKKAGERIASN